MGSYGNERASLDFPMLERMIQANSQSDTVDLHLITEFRNLASWPICDFEHANVEQETDFSISCSYPGYSLFLLVIGGFNRDLCFGA